MPRSKQGIKRPKVSEENLTNAVKAVKEDGISVRLASKKFSVSRTTLQRHLSAFKNGGDNTFTVKNNNDVWRVFTLEEEKCLVEYLTKASNMHYGLTRHEMMVLAYEFAKSIGKKYPSSWDTNKQAGLKWLTDFLKKHPLSLRKPRATSIARAAGFNRPVVEGFFEKYKEVLLKHKFESQNIYNMDESGLSTVHNPPKVIAPKGTKQVGGVTSSERGVNVTMISCISATGNSIPPFLIFPRVNFKNHMVNGAPPGTYGTCNPSGWSTSDIFVKFLDHFINHAHPSKENKVLIILDNHESHVTIQAINKARENGIVMLTIPPHTSHKLQPLDRGVFGPFKVYYNKACQNWTLSHPAKPITIYEVGYLVGQAYPMAFTPKNILSGFSVSGLWPINPDAFDDNEYASSLVTDRPERVEQSSIPEKEPPLETKGENIYNLQVATSSDVIYLQDANKTISAPSPPNPGSPTQETISGAALIYSNNVPSSSKLCSPPKQSQNNSHDELMSSIEKIRPYPKAEAKRRKKGGRKPGRCRVITDTPEKNAIEMETLTKKPNKNKRKNNDKETTNKSRKKLFVQARTKKTAEVKTLDLDHSSSDESCVMALEDSESDISLDELARRYEADFNEEREDDTFLQETDIEICEGNWVLVSFFTKRTVKHFVGHIISMTDGLPTVKFLRRVRNSSFFVWPQEEDISEIQKEEIVVVLPNPIEQKRGGFCFQVSFDGFNVC